MQLLEESSLQCLPHSLVMGKVMFLQGMPLAGNWSQLVVVGVELLSHPAAECAGQGTDRLVGCAGRCAGWPGPFL